LTIKFGPTEDADVRKAKKITALFDLENLPDQAELAIQGFVREKTGFTFRQVHYQDLCY